ncbi:MAG: NADH-quinone oxidoreductase subunit M [Verrucomicrobiae bacterium]|nr:NADH-quinone oxidoreductase subunit M [Verrucomicrobiae bacterium]
MSDFAILSAITFLPLFGGLILVGLNAGQTALPRKIAIGFSFATLGLTLLLWRAFDPASGELQFIEQANWIPALGVQYFVGVDGLGLLMVLLTAIVVPMALLASGKLFEGGVGSPLPAAAPRKDDGAHGVTRPNNAHLYYALILFLQAGLFGTFTALNFFHWFIFWELSLIPAFFLVRLWGGPQRSPAAMQFFVYTMVGSIAMLLAFLAMFFATSKPEQPGVFDFITLAEMGRNGTLAKALSDGLGWFDLTQPTLALVIFAGVLLGFAVKVPLMPFHTWLPTTYAEAPTPVTMLLTGVMSKMGVYGFVRILLPIFPAQINALLTPLLWLAVVTIVFSACAAFAQRDLKRMLAYSSINHLGYCLLAVFAVAKFTNNPALVVEKAAALNGVFLQMFNHGLTAAALFMFVGFLEQRAGGLRGLNDFGGLRKVAPVFCGLMGIALFSSLGLPGLNGFVGEFLIFKGVFPLAPWAAGWSVLGLLVTAIFLLTILQRVFNGPLNEKWSKLPDLTLAERALVAAPIALMFVLGLWPRLVLDVINPTVVRMVEQLNF